MPKLLEESIEEGVDEPALGILLAFKRLEYEKMGALWDEDKADNVENYSITAEDEDFYRFCSMMACWNITEPVVREKFVWYVPNENCRQLAEEITEEKFAKNDYSWWNILLDFEEKLHAPTPDDFAESFSVSPEMIIGEWARFLPSHVILALNLMYMEATKGLRLRIFDDLSEVLTLLREALEIEAAEEDTSQFLPERTILLKELYDFNALPYPLNSETTFDFLCRLGFIIPSRDQLQVEYRLAEEMPDPGEVLSLPDGWENRTEEFIKTGSVLFSYLDTRL